MWLFDAFWLLQSRGNRHTLTIRNVTYNDFGNYTCQASSTLGKDRQSLTLSGIPSVCTFDSVSLMNSSTQQLKSGILYCFYRYCCCCCHWKELHFVFNRWRMWFDFDFDFEFKFVLQPTLSNHRDQYNISWIVQSYAPILEYRLFYRKQTSNGNANPTSNNDVIHYEKFVCICNVYICFVCAVHIIALDILIYHTQKHTPTCLQTRIRTMEQHWLTSFLFLLFVFFFSCLVKTISVLLVTLKSTNGDMW